MIIIGLVGRMGSGKSTVATYLKEHYSFRKNAMADPIKKIGLILGFTENQMYNDKTEINNVFGISGREFLQKFGTDICRDVLPTVIPTMNNVWIKLMENILGTKTAVSRTVYDDVRFQDEVGALTKHGGVIIDIRRDTCLESSHASEQPVNGAHYIVDNNGSLLELYNAIDIIMDKQIGCKKKRLRFDNSLSDSSRRPCFKCNRFTENRCVACRGYTCIGCKCNICS